MSNEVRHRDIAALLAKGVIRATRQPVVAKAIESQMKIEPVEENGELTANPHVASQDHSQDGGDQ